MTDPRTVTEPPREVDPADFETDEGLDLDRLFAETRRDTYRFKWGGRWWELPHAQDLPDGIFDAYGELAKLADSDDADEDRELGAEEIEGVRKALHAAFGKRQWQQITEVEPIPLSAQFALFNAWMKWCGGDPGESSSSVASSNGTAGPSKRTSRSSTASTSAKRSTAGRRNGTRRANSSG